jgi:hypothetical protein
MLLYSMTPTLAGKPASVTILTGSDKFKAMPHVAKYVSFR